MFKFSTPQRCGIPTLNLTKLKRPGNPGRFQYTLSIDLYLLPGAGAGLLRAGAGAGAGRGWFCGCGIGLGIDGCG